MKITVKTLTQAVIPLTVEPSEKISSVKQKIAAQTKGETDKMKLICKGKVLTDEQTVEDFGIVEGDFLVLMVVKAKAGGSSSAAAAAPTSTAAPKTEEKPKAAPAPQAAPAPSSTSSSTGAPAESLLKGKELEDSVQSLVEMGYSKEEVLSAMRKAYNNPHRAFEYLASGMAGGVEETAETQGIIPSEVPLGEEDHAEIAGMEGLPNLDEIRQLVQQQPQLLEPLLQQLAQTNPDIVRAIQQNPEAFLQYLSGAAGAGGPGPEGAGQVTVTLTPEDVEAVERLCALGFDRNRAIEAYIACDKNEMMAANYLFESNDDDYN